VSSVNKHSIWKGSRYLELHLASPQATDMYEGTSLRCQFTLYLIYRSRSHRAVAGSLFENFNFTFFFPCSLFSFSSHFTRNLKPSHLPHEICINEAKGANIESLANTLVVPPHIHISYRISPLLLLLLLLPASHFGL
jgi:hypothetical protein